jgi:glycosyltransferase involved in cell wall biosynthesis
MRWRPSSEHRVRVGWAVAASLTTPRLSFRTLSPAVAMRIANVARWIDRNDRAFRNELYRARRRYDVVVFVKTMDDRTRREAERIKGYGGRVVFDANVNYYEVWGEYDIPDTRPTEEQRRDAREMTRLADRVVADSSYLLEVVRKLNPQSTWIPDNVDTRLFRGPVRGGNGPLRLVWSGMAQKARPLLAIADVLAGLPDAELVLVSNREPEILPELRQAIPCSLVEFSLRRYARVLRGCDVILSPKRLVNGYELGHTEWKITLGMAVGLPAVASPQRSYVEAIEHLGGGIVANGDAEWREAFERLRDPSARGELGERARRTVEERYSTPVVAAAYRDVLRSLA